jgi:hypothetical protein
MATKKTLAAIALTALLCLTIGYYINPLIQHFDPKVNVYMEVTKGEGTGPTASLFSGNLITDIGENFAGNATFGLDGNSTSWAISLSNDGSSSAAWTELPTEVAANGFSRAVGENVGPWANSGDWAMNITHTFTASGSQQLQTAGLQWSTTGESDNNLFAAADFPQTPFEASDTLTVTWVITVNAN